MPSLVPVLAVVSRLYPDLAAAPPPFRLLHSVARVRAGEATEAVARDLRLRPAAVASLVGAPDPVAALFQCSYADAGPENPKHAGARRGLGQMLLGHVAERVFERLYKRDIGTEDLVLEDSREERTDTDYRVLNGRGRPVFRINIKFHGTLFRKSQDLVGLAPEDCFALATYKIWQGLGKEEEERLPYVFLIVSVPELTGEAVGGLVPDDFARLATIVRAARKVSGLKKRDVEDGMVVLLLGDDAPAEFRDTRADIIAKLEAANWRALSAKRANRLLRDLLFERVYAVRVRGFAQNYRNAELDMHFSLNRDLTGLRDFLQVYKDGGLVLLTSKLSRGDI